MKTVAEQDTHVNYLGITHNSIMVLSTDLRYRCLKEISVVPILYA